MCAAPISKQRLDHLGGKLANLGGHYETTQPISIQMLKVLLILASLIAVTLTIKCHQCNGWHGYYPARYAQVSTCDNRNNQCETSQYCVKIVDSMTPGSEYVTYKSDCFYQTQLQVNPQNLSFVQGKLCFPFQDGSAPVKRWFYCFCNDRDYCNASFASSTLSVIFIYIVSLVL